MSSDVADFGDDVLGRFRDDGFVAVPGLFRGDRLSQLIAWVDELELESGKRGEAWFYYEDSLRGPKAKVLARIEYFDAFHVCPSSKHLGHLSLLRNGGPWLILV